VCCSVWSDLCHQPQRSSGVVAFMFCVAACFAVCGAVRVAVFVAVCGAVFVAVRGAVRVPSRSAAVCLAHPCPILQRVLQCVL